VILRLVHRMSLSVQSHSYIISQRRWTLLSPPPSRAGNSRWIRSGRKGCTEVLYTVSLPPPFDSHIQARSWRAARNYRTSLLLEMFGLQSRVRVSPENEKYSIRLLEDCPAIGESTEGGSRYGTIRY
jgi:hypothetical protein